MLLYGHGLGLLLGKPPRPSTKEILKVKDFIKDFTLNPGKEITFNKYIFPIECLLKNFISKIQPCIDMF